MHVTNARFQELRSTLTMSFFKKNKITMNIFSNSTKSLELYFFRTGDNFGSNVSSDFNPFYHNHNFISI